MLSIRHRCARTAGRFVPPILLAALIFASFTLPHHSQAARAAAPPARTFESLDALLRTGAGERLDWGTIDVFQVHESVPTAWVFVEDSTLDGEGTEYWIYSNLFIPPTPTHDDLSLRYDYVDGVSHTTLQECLDWIVATHPYIGSQAELEVHKHVVTTVP